jgi:repressor LexA
MQSPLSDPQRRVLHWLEDFIEQHQMAPSYREIGDGLGYASRSPVQLHLKTLMDKGFIYYELRMARSVRLLKSSKSIPILGAIAAHSLVTVFPDTEVEYFDLSHLPKFASLSRHQITQHFGLRVNGDSMIGALIADGDVVILRRDFEAATLKNGTIVAAESNGSTTLKYFHRSGNQVTLTPANDRYPITTLNAEEVTVQGVYTAMARDLV